MRLAADGHRGRVPVVDDVGDLGERSRIRREVAQRVERFEPARHVRHGGVLRLLQDDVAGVHVVATGHRRRGEQAEQGERHQQTGAEPDVAADVPEPADHSGPNR
ncbi:hypothetical protein [Saccharopolyspora gregorii]|uniref:Uncharacterized protein n=1 Tax=Saccharopolyspora gregorii TaxID=33914 RepID=A0ABP6RIU5_9PSEU